MSMFGVKKIKLVENGLHPESGESRRLNRPCKKIYSWLEKNVPRALKSINQVQIPTQNMFDSVRDIVYSADYTNDPKWKDLPTKCYIPVHWSWKEIQDIF